MPMDSVCWLIFFYFFAARSHSIFHRPCATRRLLAKAPLLPAPPPPALHPVRFREKLDLQQRAVITRIVKRHCPVYVDARVEDEAPSLSEGPQRMSTSVACPSCGEPFPETGDFCRNCGEFLKWDVPDEAPAEMPTEVMAAAGPGTLAAIRALHPRPSPPPTVTHKRDATRPRSPYSKPTNWRARSRSCSRPAMRW